MSEEATKTTEETKIETQAQGDNATVQTGDKAAETNNNEPSVQDLMVEIAKLKRTNDKLSSESAEWRKKYQSTLSEKEKASQEKAEKEAEKEEQFKNLLRENRMNKIEKSYLAQGWTADEASRMAVAEVDEDFDTRMKILAEVEGRKSKQVMSEFLKSRPELQYGTGNASVTQEQFDKMNLRERTKLNREQPDLYNQFIGRR